MRSRNTEPARRRPVPRMKTAAGYYGWGRQVTDAVSGLSIPRALAVPQRGGLVDRRWSEGSRDAVDPIDRWYQPPAQPVFPDPVYRLTLGGTFALLSFEAEERDDAVEDGYVWTVAGYGYGDGDAEEGLVPLYRSFASGTSDHLFTTDAAEHAAAVGGVYTAEESGLFVFETAARNRRPVYRALRSNIHFYSSDLREIERLGSDWAFEGITCYLLTGVERTLS